MTQMRRHIPSAATLLSLLLFAAACALWVRGQSRFDDVIWKHNGVCYQLGYGAASVGFAIKQGFPGSGFSYQSFRPTAVSGPRFWSIDVEKDHLRGLGFFYISYVHG